MNDSNEITDEVKINVATSPLPTAQQETQAAVWALMFMIAELALAVRSLRDQLHIRGSLVGQDEEVINGLATDLNRLQNAYKHMENSFSEKFHKILYSLQNPEEVTRQVEEAEKLARAKDSSLNEADGGSTENG